MSEASAIPYGHCDCGCGGRTRLAPQTHRGKGWVRGEPKRFILGHANKRGLHWTVNENGCWIFGGSLDGDGYGQVKDGGRKYKAHVLSWIKVKGPVPIGLVLDHLCRQRDCINPDHLEPVTHTENVRRGLVTKLTPDQVEEIRTAVGSQRQIAARFGIAQSHVCNIRRGRKWRA